MIVSSFFEQIAWAKSLQWQIIRLLQIQIISCTKIFEKKLLCLRHGRSYDTVRIFDKSQAEVFLPLPVQNVMSKYMFCDI